MDAAGSSSGSVGLSPVSKILNARLTDTSDQFLVRTTLAQTDNLIGLYQTFPSMIWGCDPAAPDGRCLGTESPVVHTTAENPISSNQGLSGTTQDTMQAHDVRLRPPVCPRAARVTDTPRDRAARSGARP